MDLTPIMECSSGMGRPWFARKAVDNDESMS